MDTRIKQILAQQHIPLDNQNPTNDQEALEARQVTIQNEINHTKANETNEGQPFLSEESI